MTRLESGRSSDAQAGFGTLFSTPAALTSPVQGQFGRPFHGDLPQLKLRIGSRLARGLDALLLWQERARQRRELAQLSDFMLRDIGITRAEAMAEAEKVFWQG